MHSNSMSKWISIVGACIFLAVLAGCAGLEYAPKRTIMYYHRELPAADRAVEAARAAGKGKECPAEYQAAEKARDEAYRIYWSCRTKEGIAKANEAAALAKALCPAKPVPVAVPPPPPPPPPPAAPVAVPIVSLSANPSAIDAGKCTTLFWSSENASDASIDQGIGGVAKSGSRQVCPASTTLYTIRATGEGGSNSASTTVTVNPPPPPPATKVIDRLTVRVNFDTDKAVIRKADTAELQKAIAFVKKYPGYNISVEGHTDNIGKDRYNQALSERRAAAVKKYLVENGAANADKIKPIGYGKTRPIADNKTAEGKFKNRRVEILILSE